MLHELRIYTLSPADAAMAAKAAGGVGDEIRGNNYGTLEATGHEVGRSTRRCICGATTSYDRATTAARRARQATSAGSRNMCR